MNPALAAKTKGMPIKVRRVSLNRPTRLGLRPPDPEEPAEVGRKVRGVATTTGRAEGTVPPFRIIRPRAAGSVAA